MPRIPGKEEVLQQKGFSKEGLLVRCSTEDAELQKAFHVHNMELIIALTRPQITFGYFLYKMINVIIVYAFFSWTFCYFKLKQF